MALCSMDGREWTSQKHFKMYGQIGGKAKLEWREYDGLSRRYLKVEDLSNTGEWQLNRSISTKFLDIR